MEDEETPISNMGVGTSQTICGTAEQARTADSFVDSIGANTHLGFTANTQHLIAGMNAIVRAVEVSGIRHLRDSSHTSGGVFTVNQANLITRVKSDTGVRVGFDLVSFPECADFTNTSPSGNLSWIAPDNIDSFEGLNEYNGGKGCAGLSTSDAQDKIYQTALYDAVQASPEISQIPVIGPSLWGWEPLKDAEAIGNLTGSMTFGNQHSYPGGHKPSLEIQGDIRAYLPMNGTKPIMATETGYHNDVMDRGKHEGPGVSEQAGGKYYSRLFFEYFNANILRTYAYDLIDDGWLSPNYSIDSMGGPEANYGLIRADGSAKPAFTAVTNEIHLLQDPAAPAFTPGSLSYSISHAPAELHHTLLQKYDGTFYLILWQEVDSYDVVNFVDIPVAPLFLKVTLPKEAEIINQYNSMSSPMKAIVQGHKANDFPVSVGDQALIIEIKMPHS